MKAIHSTSEIAHSLPIEAIEKNLASNKKNGLTNEEVQQRQKEFGKNVLEIQKPKHWLKILLEQFINPLVWVLVFAAVLAFIFEEELESIAIVIVIFINAGIGFAMELQANRSMEALKKLSVQNARVIRNGTTQIINAIELVPGDIIVMEAGDIVPADARVITQHNLGVKEAALTGESTQVRKSIEVIKKDTPVADRKNIVFKGTIVSQGNTEAIVFATGKHTELGKIASMAREATQAATPIEKKLNTLSRRLLWLTFALAIIVMLLGIWEGQEIYLMAKTSIALAIAAIPEGLPVVATIGLARGMLRLSRKKVIVKKLSAVETLGEVQVIFTDKTGTLTENELNVRTLLFEFGKFTVTAEGLLRPLATLHQIEDYPVLKKMLEVSVLCNNAHLNSEDTEEKNHTGDPLEIALLEFVQKHEVSIPLLKKQYPRIKEIPFDADTKMMGTLHEMPDGKFMVCVKGALEVVLNESDEILTDGQDKPLTDFDYWKNNNNKLAAEGERTLAFAYSIIDEPEDDFFHNLKLIGCIGFLDPPRPDIKAAIQTCQQAGIKVVMVTGDHPETARNIAHQVGLVNSDEPLVLHGNALKEAEHLDEHEIDNLLKTNVFARVSPAQKLDIVSLFQDRNYIVGMTGDGVNDAPALKKADIGIAMGQRGTEAAKEVAELVLEDDAFNSIVVAIEQGRGIFANIRHFVVYLLSCNLTEILVVVSAAIFHLGTPLFPLQILFLNMVTDVFPALALGMGKTSKDAMQHPPRKSNEPILTKQHWQTIFIYSLAMTFAVVSVNYLSINHFEYDEMMANNLTFYTLILVQLWHVFNLPGRTVSFVNNEITGNKYIWWALIICILIPIIFYQFESARVLLNLRSINLEQLLLITGFSFLPVVVIQILKKVAWLS